MSNISCKFIIQLYANKSYPIDVDPQDSFETLNSKSWKIHCRSWRVGVNIIQRLGKNSAVHVHDDMYYRIMANNSLILIDALAQSVDSSP